MEEVLDSALEKTKPSREEREYLETAFENVKKRAEKELEERDIEAEVTLVGSAARDTWISGDRDIDVFLLLPPSLERDELEEIGLGVGKKVFPNGTVEYAEHPYVKGEEGEYDVDIVPCYDVESARSLKSAVDRTPFHNEYMKENLEDTDGARLLKAFTKGVGVYGSELKTQGFSGYLCELLVIHYGGFEEVVEASSKKWSPQVYIDIEEHSREEFDDPLVVIDPTDPERNVAAVLSEDNFARFIDACREWKKNPREDLFFPSERDGMESNEIGEVIEERGTTLLSIVFDAPDIVEDQLFPQLRKTENSLVGELERRGFDVIRSKVMADERCVILVELNVSRQSRIEKHFGPPVYVEEHAESFKSKYVDSDVTGPYIEDGRYVVEREREHPTAKSFVESDEFWKIGMGEHIERELEEGYEVLENAENTKLLEEFGEEFASYFYV